MFAYIKGSLEIKTNNYVVIDVNGVGYKIFMSQKGIETLDEIGNIEANTFKLLVGFIIVKYDK